jgi:hypothetical protein
MMKDKIDGDCLWTGDIIEFEYNGGTNPGKERTALILENGAKNVSTWDFTKEELRTFTRSKIENVRFLEDDEYCELTISHLPQKLQDPAALCSAYNDMGYKCYCGNDNIIAVKVKPQVNTKMIGYQNIKAICFTAPNGNYVRLCIEPTGNRLGNCDVSLEVNGDHVTHEATAENLMDVFDSQD